MTQNVIQLSFGWLKKSQILEHPESSLWVDISIILVPMVDVLLGFKVII
jgi:hypothetical protein